MNFWTLAVALVLLLPWWVRDRARQGGRPEPGYDGAAVIPYLLLGVLGILPPSVLLSWGIAHSSASNGGNPLADDPRCS